MEGMEILNYEAREFVLEGVKLGLSKPQSSGEDGFNGKYLSINGEKQLDLTRLDYLALGSDKAIKDIMVECINQYDLSCPASQMVMKSEPNIRLEKTLADYHGMNDSIVFTNGYSANVNIINALALRMNTGHLIHFARQMGIGKLTKKSPTIFFIDGETHFSLQHGIKTAKALVGDKCIINNFPSSDYCKLKQDLQKSIKMHGLSTVRVIVSDTLSSASGKIFDIGALCEIAEEYNCLLYLDEAHAVGAMGPQGRGIAAPFVTEQYKNRIIIMGTLTKTFSQLGGYVCMSNPDLVSYLRFCSPQYIFSAPVPPWMAEATVRIINLLTGSYGENKRQQLATVSAYLRNKLVENNFDIVGSESHIVPVFVGDESLGFEINSYLQEKGFTVSLFHYPAVPKRKAVIRFSLCADVLKEEVDEVVKCLLEARNKYWS